MASGRGRPTLLAHLFAAPLVRGALCRNTEGEVGFAPVKQRDYASERDIITSTLKRANRIIEFRSEVATAYNFLLNLTGCRVLHFTWIGDGDEDKAVFEDKGFATQLDDQQIHDICQTKTLPEVVVLSAASAKEVAGAFVGAGIPNVVAVKTSENDQGVMLEFMRKFYFDLARGQTLRQSFNHALRELPEEEQERCILLPDTGDESVAPFSDADRGPFRDLTPRLPRMNCRPVSMTFIGRETQVQEVCVHMFQRTRVITIKGPAGIGKTEVALQACSYARERRLFSKMFFVSLQDDNGVPIRAMRDVEKRVMAALGIMQQDVARHYDGFLGCIQEEFTNIDEHCLLVLDGCSPCFVDKKGTCVKLSWVVEQLCQRVHKLQYIVTVVTQVGIPKERLVTIGKLTNLAAAELFIASAPREVSVPELRGGMVISGPQVQSAECLRMFAGSDIMTKLGGHPGAIVSTSRRLGRRPSEGFNLLRHEHEFLDVIIPAQLDRYKSLDAEFSRRLRECLDGEKGGWPNPPGPPEPIAGQGHRDAGIGERLWNRAVEKYAGAGASLRTLPWSKLHTHSLGPYFTDVLGEAGEYRPLQDEDFASLGANEHIWDPYTPPGRRINGHVDKDHFLGKFWPWFNAATYLLRDTGYWGTRRYPVICNFTTITSEDGAALLRGRPKGTFLVRVSTKQPGTLVIMYVARPGEVLNVRIEIDAQGMFPAKVRSTNIRAPLGPLILQIHELTHLFPDTEKREALSSNGDKV